MYFRLLGNLILGGVLIAVQLAFIKALPGWLDQLNLLLVVPIFILGFLGFRAAMWWTLGIGIVLDTFEFYPFGFELLSLVLVIVMAHLLLENYFTNRSIYSFLFLVFLASTAYDLFQNLGAFIFDFIFKQKILVSLSLGFWQREFETILMNLLAAGIIFYLVNFLSKRFKPVFFSVKSRMFY